MGLIISKALARLFWRQEDVHIFMVGLDAAGKTTILYKLRMGKVVTRDLMSGHGILAIPTLGFNVETVDQKSTHFTISEIDIPSKIRPQWHSWLEGRPHQGLIFVVDCSDREQMPEAKLGLTCLLTEELLRNACVLVFANKQDVPSAMSTAEVTEALGLTNLQGRNWHVQRSTATACEGLYEGLDWLVAAVTKSKAAPHMWPQGVFVQTDAPSSVDGRAHSS